MQYKAPPSEVNGEPDGFILDLDSLYAYLARVKDPRSARGVRYALATLLVLVVLAKLAGEDRFFGISQWIKHRKEQLAQALHLATPRAPSPQTLSRVLGQVLALDDLAQVVRAFFAAQPQAGQSIRLTLDGKTVRGTIPAGQSRGLHLLAAYLPEEGWVLLQVAVETKENEILAAPRLLQALDLRGKVVTGDALLAQRNLSAQIVEAGGAYVWTVKGNQPDLRQSIETLFAPEPVVKGFSPASHDDFQTAATFDKGHGRWERRTLTASQALQGYLAWPYAAQVFQLERQVRRVRDGKLSQEIVYGVTSLTAAQASPQRLLQLVRGHWAIENGLHYRRDETLREDWCHLRVGHAAQTMTLLNNLVVGLMLRQGHRNLPAWRRFHQAHLEASLELLLRAPV